MYVCMCNCYRFRVTYHHFEKYTSYCIIDAIARLNTLFIRNESNDVDAYILTYIQYKLCITMLYHKTVLNILKN